MGPELLARLLPNLRDMDSCPMDGEEVLLFTSWDIFSGWYDLDAEQFVAGESNRCLYRDQVKGWLKLSELRRGDD